MKKNHIIFLGITLILLVALFSGVAEGALLRGISKNVATAGVKEAISSSTFRLLWVVIQVKRTNTGAIFVETEDGVQQELPAPIAGLLLPWMRIPGNSRITLSDIYIDSAVNGEGVNVHYLTQVN